jgi:hypothetical protein
MVDELFQVFGKLLKIAGFRLQRDPSALTG